MSAQPASFMHQGPPPQQIQEEPIMDVVALGRRVADQYPENGRFYCLAKRGAYMFPVDETESNRLDIMHKVIQDAMDGKLHNAPLHMLPPDEHHFILDLGTGTGIWPIEMAKSYQSAVIHGVDLIANTPDTVFPNQRFFIMDIESEWTAVTRPDYHLIYARMLNGAIQDWQRLYHEVFTHLRPGGWFEQVEIDWTPHYADDGTKPANPVLLEWANEVAMAMRDANRPIAADTPRTSAALAAAGFVDFNEQIIELPYSGWPEGRLRDLGRWVNLGFVESVYGLSVGPLTRMRGYSQQQVWDLVQRVKQEAMTRKIHAYCRLHVYTAKRP